MADKPITREEKYLAYLTGDYAGELPKPITRKEKYLYELCLKEIGGEISPEEIKNAVNDYLEKNPVKPGATTEQAQQIEQNKTDITSLKDKTNSLNEEKSDTLDYNNGVLRLLSGETELSRAIISDGTPGVPARIEKTSSDTTAELDSNKLYIFPEMSSLTYTLATPSDTSIANEYHFVFRSGATSTELVHPSGVSVPDGFTVDKNKVYEISILEGCLAYQSWAVS